MRLPFRLLGLSALVGTLCAALVLIARPVPRVTPTLVSWALGAVALPWSAGSLADSPALLVAIGLAVNITLIGLVIERAGAPAASHLALGLYAPFVLHALYLWLTRGAAFYPDAGLLELGDSIAALVAAGLGGYLSTSWLRRRGQRTVAALSASLALFAAQLAFGFAIACGTFGRCP